MDKKEQNFKGACDGLIILMVQSQYIQGPSEAHSHDTERQVSLSLSYLMMDMYTVIQELLQ